MPDSSQMDNLSGSGTPGITGNNPAVWNSELNDPGYAAPEAPMPKPPEGPMPVWGGKPIGKPIGEPPIKPVGPIRVSDPIRIAPHYGLSYLARRGEF